MSFTVFINSYPYSGACANCAYQFDWQGAVGHDSKYKGKYKMTFKFVSKIIGTISAANSLKILTIQGLGVVSHSFSANFHGGFDNNLNLGVLNMNSSQNAYETDYDSNPPIILNGLPTGNNFSIVINNESGTQDTYINGVDYLLTLFFEQFDE